MNEITLQWISFSKLVYCAIFALFYGFGGISGKWTRRFLGSGLLTLGLIGYGLLLHTFSWWYLLTFPLLSLALSLGYGADKLSTKILKRSYCAVAYILSTISVFIITGKYELLALHIILCFLFSVWGGVRGIFGSARAEETSIGFIIGYLPLLAL